MSRVAITDRLRREIDALEDLSREELVGRWQKAHGCLPPKGVKRNLLLHSAAWQLQARQLGGLKGEAKRTIQSMIRAGWPAHGDDQDAGSQQGRKPVRHLRGRLAPGARLVREWNGRLHAVQVADDGFLYDGKTYRSLTAVAQRITGTNWSGPRFFGL